MFSVGVGGAMDFLIGSGIKKKKNMNEQRAAALISINDLH